MQLGHETEVKAGGRTTSSHLCWKSHGDSALLGVVRMTSESSLFKKALSRCVNFLGSLEDLLTCWTGTYLNFKLWRERRLIIATCQTKATTLIASCYVSEAAEKSSVPLSQEVLRKLFFPPPRRRSPWMKTDIEKFPNLSERSIKVPMHWFWPWIFSARLPLHACSTLLSGPGGVLQEGLSAPRILFTSSGTLQTSGVQRPVTSMV